MDSSDRKKRPVWRIIVVSLVGLLAIVATFLYFNYNRLLSRALRMSFESSIMAEVYELNFESLRINLVDRSIKVMNVSLLPREKPLRDYPYINSSFKLTTDYIALEGVELRTLLRMKKLVLRKILIDRPHIEVALAGQRHIMLPFGDTTSTSDSPDPGKKKALDSFSLDEFQLADASFRIKNDQKLRSFELKDLDISMRDISLSGKPGEYGASFSQVTLAMGEFKGALQEGPVSEVNFENFRIGIDSPSVNLTLDTAIYRLHDFTAGFNNLDLQTAQGTFQLAVLSFDLSYKEQSVSLKGASFKPNVSHAELQKDHAFQHTEFSGSIGSLDFSQINFDSLLYRQTLLVDEIQVSDVKASVYKDKTKPMDTTRLPVYLGQSVASIPIPVHIRSVKVTRASLENTERKPDSTLAKASITRGRVEVRNITNRPTRQGLVLRADARLMDKVRFKIGLEFHYRKPEFTFEGVLDTFALSDLNPLINAYTPAVINKGVSDHIEFSGLAGETRSAGKMRFLYHDLEVDLRLVDQARWKSAVIAFAANTLLHSSNPPSAGLPPREVDFQVDRDMHKGFVNVIIKSMLNGLKETMIMSKENRKAYQEERRKSKEKQK